LHRLGEGKLLADLDQVRKVRLTALTPPVCQCRLIEIEIDDCDLCFLAGEESGESRVRLDLPVRLCISCAWSAFDAVNVFAAT
jgi:hypothetical protein